MTRCEHCNQLLPTGIFSNGIITIFEGNREVYFGGNRVEFTKKQFDLLLFFIKNKGKVLTFKDIMLNVWGKGYIERIEYIRVIFVEIRKKFPPELSLDKVIESKRSIGYRMREL